MTFWLEELQKKRRQYSHQRKIISSEKITWTLKNQRKGSGLTGHGKGTAVQPDDEGKDSSDGGSPKDDLVEMRSPSDSQSANTRLGQWSLFNLRSEIRDAVSNIRTQISPTATTKFSPPISPSAEAREDWTVLERDAESHPPANPNPPPQPTSPPATTDSGNSSGKFGGKLATTFKMFKPRKSSQSESGSSTAKEQGSRKLQPSSGTQTCYKCKALQGDLYLVRDEMRVTEEELEANRQIIKLLQKELDVMRVAMETRNESEGKSEDEKDAMLQQRDKHVVELEHSQIFLQEQRTDLTQKIRFNEGELATLRDQVTMLQDMLSAKDEIIVTLTNQIFELENNNAVGNSGDQEQLLLQRSSSPSPAMLMADAREVEALRDSVRAYQMQNNFLTKEIMELNELRKLDEKREKEMLINYANMDAMYCQTRSKYLFLLNEKQEPVRGGDESRSQEAVAQLLQEALETEAQLGAASTKDLESQHSFLSTQGQEHDRYGFLVRVSEEETDDVLVAKANQLQRQSDEINSRIKDVDETTSKHIKWENFMVGQAGKPLVRSPELKALIRMGVPHEYKEHIWRGCINFYVAQTRDKLGPMYYKKDLGERIKSSKSNPAVKQIELDLLRTLPSNHHFESMDSDGIPKLRRVLLSYSVHNPIIGYCQGLNRLAAIALLFLSEEESFWCLEAIVGHIMPKDYYTKTLAAAQADQRVLKELVTEKLPKLTTHLEQHDVDLSLYTFNWFLTIFVDNVLPETFLRIWDAFLYEGSKMLFRFALAFLKYAEEEILTLKEAPHIYRYMRMLGEKVNNVKKITHIAFHELNPFPMRTVASKRAHHIQMVMEELRELDAIRQDFQSSHSPGGREGYNFSDDDLNDTRDEDDDDDEEEEDGVEY
ncbi:TBC1 domain family member 2B-like [Littorina saxatilis]|uniref:TBC1 domain family member 2B-like n=1 Tax=Littorina saxatilis TaxID=31220 RepID=UPI0038B480C5